MRILFDALSQRASHNPQGEALISEHVVLSNRELLLRVELLANELVSAQLSCIGLYMDNSIDWVITDLAAMKAGISLIPIPLFFTRDQIQHLIDDAGIEAVMTRAEQAGRFNAIHQRSLMGSEGVLLRLPRVSRVDARVAKVTYTSGSTGQPKGVCLSLDNLQSVCQGITAAMDDMQLTDHLCVMPLATLLENVAGVYVPLLRGGAVIVLSLASLGFDSNCEFDIQRLAACITRYRPDSVILLPHILKLAVTTEYGVIKLHYQDDIA